MTDHGWPADDLVVQSSDMALMNVASLARSGALDLSPRFQRRNRWDRARQSRLIESFLLNVPVPPVYLAEERHGRFAVIDGKQRLTAIAKFLNREYKLSSLDYLKDLEGLGFEDLPSALLSTLNMRPLRAVIVMRQTAEWMKHEVFLRLNTGGQPLNPQEVRNVTFAGRLNDAIMELSEHQFLRRQLKIRSATSPAYTDMTDVEYVLRFMTLAESWRDFGGDLRPALDDFMINHRDATSKEVTRLTHRFLRSITSCMEIWGDLAFKRFDGRQWRDQMIGAVYDAQMVACDLVSDDTLNAVKERKPQAKSGMVALFQRTDFEAAIRTSTNTATRVRLRIDTVRQLLESLASE